MWIAITRQVSPRIDRCELTNLDRQPIDLPRAREQHLAYEAALRSSGVEVHSLPAEPDLPDSVFVEDAAVVVDECAVITRPGADSRKPETASIARALAPYRDLFTIQAPGSLDGGDVLVAGRKVTIGTSTRTNPAAIEQMRAFLAPCGYEVAGVTVKGCLHLKSAVTRISDETLLVNPAWVNADTFHGFDIVEVDPSEPYAANALWAGCKVIYQPGFPRTLERLETRGFHPLLVDQSELGKAEGALTCCSLVFKFDPERIPPEAVL